MNLQLSPLDEANRTLQANVGPADWKSPEPKSRYHLVVLGGGTAGLVAAAGAAGLGAKVALVERHLLGGDCLNFGCVPSKALISAARQAASVRHAERFGIHTEPNPTIRFPDVMERVRQRRADISPHDSARRFQDLGVDVFFGTGAFIEPGTLAVDDLRLRYRRALIATGTRPAIPPIKGLAQVSFLTNETLFSLIELPRRLAVLGGGPIGVEMAQAFARLGSQVTLIERGDRILPKEDHEAVEIVQSALREEGVQLRLNCQVSEVEQPDVRGPIRSSLVSASNSQETLETDQLLVATGRTPNVDQLQLDRVGVQFDSQHGVQVDSRMRTTSRNVFAAGDVATQLKFTHHADFLARIVIQNAVFPGRAKASRLIVPRVTYTAPELAQVGLTEEEAHQQGVEIQTFTQVMKENDRAIVEDCPTGFVKVHVRRGTDRIVGATIVNEIAGELIPQIVLAMQHKLGLKKLAATMYAYPTQADSIRKLGDEYQRTRLTPWLKTLLNAWLRWTG